jgi:hypothetical protein
MNILQFSFDRLGKWLARPVKQSTETSVKFIITLCRYSDYATGWTVRGSITGRCKRFSLFQNVHTGSETHSASHQIDTWGLFLWGKGAGAWSWPLTEVKNECTCPCSCTCPCPCPCTSTPTAYFKAGTTGATPFTYFLLIIIVLFSWYSTITNLQKCETYGETGGQYMVVTLEHSFPYKSWKPGAMPHKKVPE